MKMRYAGKWITVALCISAIWSITGCSDPGEPVPGSAIPDTIPPARITDIMGSNISPSRVTLVWTAPGDDGASGRALSYDLRFSEVEITEGNWDQCPIPELYVDLTVSPSGGRDSTRVLYLKSNTDYWFALKASDSDGNSSPVSENYRLKTPNQPILQYVKQVPLPDVGWTSPFRYIEHSPSRIIVVNQLFGSCFIMETGDPGRGEFGRILGQLDPYEKVWLNGWSGLPHSDGRYLYATKIKMYIPLPNGNDYPPEPLSVHIFDLTMSPVQIGSVSLENRFDADFLEIPNCSIGNTLFVGADTLGVIDISDPANPEFRGYGLGLDYQVRGMQGIGSNLVVWNADKDTPIAVLEVTDPHSPTVVGWYDPEVDYTSVYFSDKLLLVLERSGFLQVVDLTDPTHPGLRSKVNLGTSESSVAVNDGMLYSSRPYQDLQVFSLENPDEPILLATCGLALRPGVVFATNELVFLEDARESYPSSDRLHVFLKLPE